MNSQKTENGTGKVKSKVLPMAECKDQILLRHIPCEVVQMINRKKIEIMNNNPHRMTVSNSEAIYKLILKESN